MCCSNRDEAVLLVGIAYDDDVGARTYIPGYWAVRKQDGGRIVENSFRMGHVGICSSCRLRLKREPPLRADTQYLPTSVPDSRTVAN
jgi:hypothetical protein